DGDLADGELCGRVPAEKRDRLAVAGPAHHSAAGRPQGRNSPGLPNRVISAMAWPVTRRTISANGLRSAPPGALMSTQSAGWRFAAVGRARKRPAEFGPKA